MLSKTCRRVFRTAVTTSFNVTTQTSMNPNIQVQLSQSLATSGHNFKFAGSRFKYPPFSKDATYVSIPRCHLSTIKQGEDLEMVQEEERSKKLQQVIKNEIRVSGFAPMSLARFMELALMHQEYGYYSTKEKIFNKGGDFTTSPEISQMFGEMVAVWLVTAFKNYEKLKFGKGYGVNPKDGQELQQQAEMGINIVESQSDLPSRGGGTKKKPKLFSDHLQSVNLVELGPGSGIMMCDILRTLKQLGGNLRNIQIVMIEASENLRKSQQDRLLKFLQEDQKIFMSYDIKSNSSDEAGNAKSKKKSRQQGNFGNKKSEVDRFFNKDQNVSIAWYSSLKEYYNDYLTERLALVDKITEHGKKSAELSNEQAQDLIRNPCFLIAHELYDALPIHQFHYSEKREWCEKVVQINQETDELEFQITPGPTENTLSKLQPEKLFSDEAKQDIRPGDSIEICPESVQFTKDICSLIELSKGMALVIDYGEDHSFSSSFRGLKNHELVKDEQTILDNVGNMDLTAYVNFQQIRQVAQTNNQIRVEGPLPQGQFLECMGIAVRVEQLQAKVRKKDQKQQIWDSYARLADPKQMGAIYKIMFLGDKAAGEVYPFLSEETVRELMDSYK